MITSPAPTMADTGSDRVISRLSAATAGPTLVCVAAIHGNEPAGVKAARRVANAVDAGAGLARGDFVALIGNLEALAGGQRFLRRDLNRGWTSLRRPETDESMDLAEDGEQRELGRHLIPAVDQARGPVYFMDLHTTSGDGKPFIVIADSLPSRRFALSFASPLVLGLEEHLDGTLIDVITREGHAAIAFEGGRSGDPQAVTHLEAAIWTALVTTTLIEPSSANGASGSRRILEGAAAGLPKIVETRYHHAIEPRDRFVMEKGWQGFDLVERGQALAQSGSGRVTAPESGYILMPLYQERGSEGFFIVRKVRRFWLLVSAALRGLRIDSVVHLLPGVRRDRADRNTLLVSRRTARLFPVEILHLLGFKRVGETSGVVHMRRRVY